MLLIPTAAVINNEALLVPIVLFCALALVLITKIVFASLTQMVTTWRETALKERLVAAGMSAVEIERVVNAGHPRAGGEMADVEDPVMSRKPPIVKPVV